MSEHSSTGQIRPLRIQLSAPVTVTAESILRSRIAELEAQVENLKAQLREKK